MCALVVRTNAFIRKMTDNLFPILFLLGAIFCLLGCQSPQKTDQLNSAAYYLRYTAADSLVKTAASFKNSNQQNLSFLGGVQFLQEKMEFNQNDQEYSLEKKISLPETVTFQFQNENLESIRFSHSFIPAKIIASSLIINRNEDFLMEISNAKLEKEASLGILLIDSQQKTIAVFYEEDPVDGFRIPKDRLKTIQKGAGKLFLVQKENRITQQETFEHHLKMEYYGVPMEIEIR